jgi:peptidoglycan/xylan/chitin deacetylase (PgdA/CDA1 family)
MKSHQLYYYLKPVIPRQLVMPVRRMLTQRRRRRHRHIWPIDAAAAAPPDGWAGWPNGKRFALVLTHDVETARGCGRCRDLMQLEEDLGFRSAFFMVPEKYEVPPELRLEMEARGFEVGVHGLKHDGRLYQSREVFAERAERINSYLDGWSAVGFRSPLMHHNLSWMHDLRIEYDASTFDTDPFEPQNDGVGTIFPFFVRGPSGDGGYVELPYTLAQDSTLFLFLEEASIDLWKRKLDWVAEHGGMVMVTVHPDYMRFGHGRPDREEYRVARYVELLEYVRSNGLDEAWAAQPREVARFCRQAAEGNAGPDEAL